MKYYTLILFLVVTVNVFSQASLGIDDFKIKDGETKVFQIKMQNDVPIRSLQVRLILPESLELVSMPTLNADRIGSYIDEFGNIETSIKTINYNKWSDGSYMIVVNSEDAVAFASNDGVIISMSIRAKENVLPQTVTISLQDIELVYENGRDVVRQNNCNCSVKVYQNYNISAIAEKGGTVLGGGIYESDSIVILTAVPDDGYKFQKWSNGSIENPYKFIANDNIELFAIFSPNKYKFVYLIDGEVYKTDSIAYGTTLTLEVEPEKEGHTFSGWSELPATMPASDVIVSGNFTVNCYAVTYVVDGEAYKTDSVTYGTAITLPEKPTKEGYTFVGWGEVPETMPAGDLTFTASYTLNSYLLSYTVDGEIHKSDSIAYGTTLTLEAEPAKVGHTFSGWSELPATMPASDVIVSGNFTVNCYAVTYMVDGEAYKTDSVTYGTVITLPEKPTKEGYTFAGWGEVPETMPAGDLTFTASYTLNSYLLSYTVDGEIHKSDSIAYGTTLTLEAEPAKVGHTFSGWSELPAMMPASDVIVSGNFTVNRYAVTYVVDGEVYKTDSVTYGTAITLPEAPGKPGYDFAWIDVPTSMPAYDITIYGSYTSGIESVYRDNELVMVYTLQGVPVYSNVRWQEAVKELPTGVYVVKSSKGTYKIVL